MLNKKGSEFRRKKKRLRDRESKPNRKLRGKESRLNKKLRDREKKRSIRNWNLINTGTIQVLEKPIPLAKYSTVPISMKI
jgi:hypothetical protein